jgi:hypothetical protein
MIAVCARKEIFIFLNQWDIGLSALVAVSLVLAITASTDAGKRFPPALVALFIACSILSLYTGWRATGSLILSLLLFLPKMLIISTLVILGTLSVLFSIGAALMLHGKKHQDAGKAAAYAAGTGAGSYYLRKLVFQLMPQ